jgi:hypothetical protein
LAGTALNTCPQGNDERFVVGRSVDDLWNEETSVEAVLLRGHAQIPPI